MLTIVALARQDTGSFRSLFAVSGFGETLHVQPCQRHALTGGPPVLLEVFELVQGVVELPGQMRFVAAYLL
jgi:hypothetical protein